MLNRSGFFALIGAVALIVPLASSGQERGDSVEVWLNRMNSAVAEYDFRGSFVHVVDGNAETLNIVHRVDDGVIRERISPSDGEGREILRNGDIVRTVIPDKQRIVQEELHGASTTLAGPFNYSEELGNYYEMKTFPKGNIAGRDTQVIQIQARDRYRYSYRLSVDSETGLPLKVQIRDGQDDIVELVLFTEIDYVDAIASAELESVIDTRDFSWVRPIKAEFEAAGDELWGVNRLPDGFHLSVAKRSLLAGSEYPVQHLVYTDGLATVSVFVAHPKSEFEMTEGFSGSGSTNAYTLTIDGRLATVLGEVPRRTVFSIANSLNAR